MIFHWKRDKRAVVEAHKRADSADKAAEEAIVRRMAVDRLAAQSRRITKSLHDEVDKNGFTELLEKAWARR